MKNFLLFTLYFALSAVLTWLFVALCPLYISREQMLLSSSIAGGKWGIQIILALLFLKERSLLFSRKIGSVCFSGSLVLIPFIVSAYFKWNDNGTFFFVSLLVAVLLMIMLYHQSIKALKLPLKWWIFWLICLAIAITLQLTVVFHYF